MPIERHQIREIEHWTDLKKFIEGIGSWWVFRGQKDSSWPLLTSLERACPQGLLANVAEDYILGEFTRSAHHFVGGSELPKGRLEWLAIMQHHGAPTRLMDWTTSPYVAAFFALNKALDEDGTCALWAMRTSWFKQENERRVNDTYDGPLPVDGLSNPRVFGRVFCQRPMALVGTVQPHRKNRRMLIQQGVFVCPGDINMGFEGNLGSYNSSDLKANLAKIVLPSRVRADALADLRKMNITETTLFPGIDGFARSLRNELHLLAKDHYLLKQVQDGISGDDLDV
jgi:hypothetical protein